MSIRALVKYSSRQSAGKIYRVVHEIFEMDTREARVGKQYHE